MANQRPRQRLLRTREMEDDRCDLTNGIDLMMVFSVLFLVLAATATTTLNFPLQLASTTAGQPADRTNERHFVAIDANGGLAWGENPVDERQLMQHLKSVHAASPESVIGVVCDRSTPFERTAAVLAAIAEAELAACLITEERRER